MVYFCCKLYGLDNNYEMNIQFLFYYGNVKMKLRKAK